jgi:hypothetical protein
MNLELCVMTTGDLQRTSGPKAVFVALMTISDMLHIPKVKEPKAPTSVVRMLHTNLSMLLSGISVVLAPLAPCFLPSFYLTCKFTGV